MIKLLHFADAHIDMANYGRHDAQSGLPLRVMDYLKSLDTIVDTAISEKVDLVLFAGDAYKDRNPAPTFQREWGRRIMRLSRAGIPTLLLVGNHDLSPALGRAHALETFDTLEVPHVQVLSRPQSLGPQDLEGLPVQVIALPWIARSGIMAQLEMHGGEPAQVYEALEARLGELIDAWLEAVDPDLPVVLTAHASVQGASFGGERTVMLGSDLVLSGALVRNPRLDYVALGHIHKPQDLNPDGYPPVIYPGSIERVDFGEARDDKFFIIAHVERRATRVEWRQLTGIRPFFDCHLRLETQDALSERLRSALPQPQQMEGAIVRLVLEYPREWEALIDEAALRDYTQACLEFHLVKRPQVEARIRLPDNHAVGSLTPLELLDMYWAANHTEEEERRELASLAGDVIHGVQDGPGEKQT
jgi:DNA repair protein SbcD/Mre11